MTKQEYYESFKDPRWQKKRLEILERDEWICKSCGEKHEQLHAHHTVYYDMYPWEYGNNTIVTLCDTCHKDEHDLRAMGFLSTEMISVAEILRSNEAKENFKEKFRFYLCNFGYCNKIIKKQMVEDGYE